MVFAFSKRGRYEGNMSYYNIVLLEPEIPQNTGNIGRVCVGFNCHLHLIKPFGFELSDKNLKRAGLDYWQDLKWTTYENWGEFYPNIESHREQVYFMTTKTEKSLYSKKFKQGDWFIFGKETKGIPEQVLKEHESQNLTIPFPGQVRSFNLANSVSIVASEAFRQLEL